MAQKAWRCSQCGAINEPGSRACQACGKWPSLFDLQDDVVEEPVAEARAQPTVEVGEFEPQTFEPVTFDPRTYEADAEQWVEQTAEEPAEPRRRTPRWLGTAVWVVIIAVWLIVNALADSN
jgi:hypothetical protein